MNKKMKGGIGAAVAALIYGGAQLLDMESRIAALEGLHPELITGVAMDPPAQEPAQGDEEPGKPDEAGPVPDPAPGADHLELDESGEWVEAEAPK
tara:strand:- start:4275 stop:4559 length:285 start_codon:yes stop_codon:yes gene_type:complete